MAFISEGRFEGRRDQFGLYETAAAELSGAFMTRSGSVSSSLYKSQKNSGSILLRVYFAAKTYAAVSPLLDTVKSICIYGDGIRATIQAAAVCADEINTAFQEGTPLRTLVGPRSTGDYRYTHCGNITHEGEISRPRLHVVVRDTISITSRPVAIERVHLER